MDFAPSRVYLSTLATIQDTFIWEFIAGAELGNTI